MRYTSALLTIVNFAGAIFCLYYVKKEGGGLSFKVVGTINAVAVVLNILVAVGAIL